MNRDFSVACPPPEHFSSLGGEKRRDVLDYTRADLLWSCFCGRPRLQVGDTELSPEFDWVPLLHFMYALTMVAAALDAPEKTGVYHFTESGDALSFRRIGADVAVAATYTPGVGVAGYTAMRAGLAAESHRLAADVEHAEPRIRRHPAWPEIRRRLSGGGGEPPPALPAPQ